MESEALSQWQQGIPARPCSYCLRGSTIVIEVLGESIFYLDRHEARRLAGLLAAGETVIADVSFSPDEARQLACEIKNSLNRVNWRREGF
jgi:hypothetical protein